jgi:hypothetical protein
MRQLTRDPGGLFHLSLCAKEAALLKEVLTATTRQRDALAAESPVRPKLDNKIKMLIEDLDEKWQALEHAINKAYPEIM